MEAMEARRRCGRGRREEEDGSARRAKREREARRGRWSSLSWRVQSRRGGGCVTRGEDEVVANSNFGSRTTRRKRGATETVVMWVMDVGSRMLQLGGSMARRRRRWLQFRQATTVVRGGGCGVGWCGRERRRLGLRFWLCEGERPMRCHVLVGYFSEWEIEDVAYFHWLI